MSRVGSFLAAIMPHGDLPKRSGRPAGKEQRTTQPFSRGDQHWRPARGKFYVFTPRGKAMRQTEADTPDLAGARFAEYMQATGQHGDFEARGFTVRKA